MTNRQVDSRFFSVPAVGSNRQNFRYKIPSAPNAVIWTPLANIIVIKIISVITDTNCLHGTKHRTNTLYLLCHIKQQACFDASALDNCYQ
jgi:hypothetical protein